MMTDWYPAMDRILHAQDAGWQSIAEDIGWQLVEDMNLTDISDTLEDYPKSKYRHILAWVAGYKGEESIPLLEFLARDENDDVRKEAERWLEYLIPPEPEPVQLELF
jgi:hypothetical protein